MNPSCEDIRDVLPELVSGRLSAQAAIACDAHVAGCEECRLEVHLAHQLTRNRVVLPAGLHDRVMRAVGEARRGPRLPSVPLAVAASLAMLVVAGRMYLPGLTRPEANRFEGTAPAAVSDARDAHGAGWMTVEGALNSGAATLGDLSEEQLRELLTELGS